MAGKFTAARIGAVVVALGVVLAGCTGPAQPGGGSSHTAIWPTHESSSPTPSASPSLTDDQLYQMAVQQYRSLYKIMTQIDQVGGTPELPEQINAYVMDPARSAIADLFSNMYYNGNRYDATPEYKLSAVAIWVTEDPPAGAVVAIHTCEEFQGAAMVSPTGDVIQDGSRVTMHRRGYFKMDPSDSKLKVFILNGEAVNECPI